MTVRTILEYPDPKLRAQAAQVTEFDESLAELAEDLVDTLQASGPVLGLCAPQLGDLRQVLAIRVGKHGEPVVFVNPTIVHRKGLGVVEERCLSVPDTMVRVWRPLRVKVVYQTVEGFETERTLEQIEAVAIQHEMEHFEGKLLVDHMGFLRRWAFKRSHPEESPRPTA